MDTQKMLAEVNAELERLTRVRDALMGIATGTEDGRGRHISESGKKVISVAAQLRSAKAKGDKAAIKARQAELEQAKKDHMAYKEHLKAGSE
jgi:hypothetical protein